MHEKGFLDFCTDFPVFCYYQSEKRPSAMVTKFVFFRGFYNSCGVLFLLIRRNSPFHT